MNLGQISRVLEDASIRIDEILIEIISNMAADEGKVDLSKSRAQYDRADFKALIKTSLEMFTIVRNKFPKD